MHTILCVLIELLVEIRMAGQFIVLSNELREKCIQKMISVLKLKDMMMLINQIFRMDLQSNNRPYFTLRPPEGGPQDHQSWSCSGWRHRFRYFEVLSKSTSELD